jgi:hypothetical protein
MEEKHEKKGGHGMNILEVTGKEYEKALPTTLEDLFNESTVVYEHEGKRHSFTVTYVRYFDEYVREQGIYDAEATNVPFHNIVALLILLKKGTPIADQRQYYNETQKFLKAFRTEDIDKALDLSRSLPTTSSQQ